MTFIDNLANINEFVFNNTLVNNTDDIIPNVVSNANDVGGDLWYYSVIFILWMYLIYRFYRKDEPIAIDIIRSMFFSSSWCLSISVGMVLSKLVTNIMPTIWFGIVWLLLLLSVLGLQRKNQ